MSDEERQKIIAQIDFEEKWLTDIKMENGFISLADIRTAMNGIRIIISKTNVIAVRKGENNDK